VKVTRCSCSFCRRDPSLKHWLTCQCSRVDAARDRQVPIPFELVQAGSTCTHVTHVLYKFKGPTYCNKCGSRGERPRLHKLSKPCQPTHYGKDPIKALATGNLPAYSTDLRVNVATFLYVRWVIQGFAIINQVD